MRVIIQVIRRNVTDEQALELKRIVTEAVKDQENVEITMHTLG